MDLVRAFIAPFQTRADDRAWLNDRRYFPQFLELKLTDSLGYVSPEMALTNPVFSACLRKIWNAVGMMPCFLYKRTKNDGREKARRDPRYKLVHGAPCREYTKMEFEREQIRDYFLYGNAFAQIVRDSRDRPVELWPLKAKNMLIGRNAKGELRYRLLIPGTLDYRQFEAYEIVHRRYATMDGVIGLSIFELAANSIALGLSMEKYVSKFFANDATPRGVLTTPAILEPSAKEGIRVGWEKHHKGPENKHKIGILDGGLDFKPVGMSHEHAELLESRRYQDTDIARWFDMQEHKVGNLERSTNNNIEHQDKEFIRDTVSPHLAYKEQVYTRDLLTVEEQEYLYVEHELDGMLKGDFPEQNEAFSKAVEKGIMSINDVRKRKNMGSVKGGNRLLIPLNMALLDPETGEITVPVKQDKKAELLVEEEGTDESVGKLKRAFQGIFADICNRAATKESLAVSRQLKKQAKGGTVEEFRSWCLDFYREEEVTFMTAIRPVIAGVVEMAGVAVGELVVEKVAGDAAKRRSRTSLNKISNLFECCATTGDAFLQLEKEFQSLTYSEESVGHELSNMIREVCGE